MNPLESDAPGEAADSSSDHSSPLESALGGSRPTPKSGWLSTLLAEDFDVWKAVGGVRGLAETLVPSLVFIVVYTATKSLLPSVIAPLVVAVVALGVRIVQRIDIVPALGGLIGIAFSVFWAWRSGEVSNYFALGLLTNTGYALVLLVSLAVRWPALGLVIGMLRGDVTGWRNDPDQRLTRRRYTQVTWLWLALFVARVVVQGPLYFAGATTALAVARLIMGPFIYALVAWFSWLMVRGLPPVPGRTDS